MRKCCDFNMSWIMPIHLLTCMSNSCPPLPTSFYRVSAVLIFRWYSHNRVVLEGSDWKPGAWYTWKVQKAGGDATEENWAWWEHCYLFNTINIGSLNFLTLPTYNSPLPTPHSPLTTPHSPLTTPHSPLPTSREILTVTKTFPIKPYYLNTIHYFLAFRHGYEKP